MSFFALLNSETVDSEQKSPWTTLAVKAIYDNPWIALTEYDIINPSGMKGIYGKVHFKNKAVGIVALDDARNTYLVGQYRYTLNAWSWEIPEGGSPLGGDVLESAKRELKEETGLAANRWTLLQRVHLSNSVSDEEGFIFLAEGLTSGTQALEETEADLKVRKLPFEEALQMVMEGEITDSLSVIGIMRVGRILDARY
jgi:8-oxo-dGTP pyrophosphatase MutT (NUDIX family)